MLGLEEMMYRAVWEPESRDHRWSGRLGLLAMTDMNGGIKSATKRRQMAPGQGVAV